MDAFYTPWHETGRLLLKAGKATEAAAYLVKPPADMPDASKAMRDLLLIHVFLLQGKKKEAQSLYERLLWSPHTPHDLRDRLRTMSSYFLHVWRPRVHDLRTHEALPDTHTPCGGSIAVLADGSLGVLVRVLNVMYTATPPDTKPTLKQTGDRWKRYVNTLYWIQLDTTLRTLLSYPMHDRARVPRANDAFVGYEDPRLFLWDGHPWMSATSYQLYRSGKAHTVLCGLDDDRVTSCVPLQCPDMNSEQKHWLPWVHARTPHFLYSCAPWTVLRLDDRMSGATSVVAQKTIARWPTNGSVRGAAGPVPYLDGYLAILAYTDVVNDTEHVSYHYVRISKDLMPVALSSRWNLWEPELETIQGLAIQGEYLYLVYGHQQKELRSTRFLTSLITSVLQWVYIK